VRRKAIAACIAAAVLPLSAAACSSATSGGGSSGTGSDYTVNWWTWDPNQAAAYEQCIPGFEKAHPGIRVQVSQYDVNDYFTKLTADFVAGNAPDAFQDSLLTDVGELQPLNSYLSSGQLNQYSVGVSSVKGPDGQPYGLPMDWATAAMYYNESAVKQAGLTEQQIQNMTWNPVNGGTFEKIVAHLTIDDNGVRGDQPGFDKNHIKQYGIGVLDAADFSGQTSWFPFAASTGWTMRGSWATSFSYDNPKFIQTMDWVKKLVADGYSPSFNQSTLSDSQLVGSGKVAMTVGGSWEATTFAALPGIKVGIAPTVDGPVGRRSINNSNMNVMWQGSKDKQATFAWMSYQESAACQTKAATYNGSFFPSISSSMNALVSYEQAKGVDLSVFTQQRDQGELIDQVPAKNWTEIGNNLNPIFEAYFLGEKNDSVWQQADQVSAQSIAGTAP
jgi:multiple sugar transport system substrate-binding protein